MEYSEVDGISSLPLESSTLPDFVIRKAEEELGETENKRIKCLQELKERIASLWDPEIVDFEEILRFGLLCNEKELQNPITQICGIVTVLDLKGLSWSHLFHIPTSSIRCHISAVQDSFPIRHKAIHIINNPSIFSLLFTVIKPLLKYKIRDRIHFHGDNLNSLHEFLDPSLLPKEFGGTQEPFQNESFYASLRDSEEFFVERNTYGYVERS